MIGGWRVGEFSARLGNGAPKFVRGLKARPRAIALRYGDPFVNDDFSIRDSFGVGLAVGHTAGQFGNFDNKAVVLLAPVNDELVAHRFRRNGSHVLMTVNAPRVA